MLVGVEKLTEILGVKWKCYDCWWGLEGTSCCQTTMQTASGTWPCPG